MGQNVLGVLYGCIVPEDLVLRRRAGDDGDDELLDKWVKGKRNRKLGLRTPAAGDKHLIGFWVGIGGDEKGVLDISGRCIPLTVIEKTREARVAMANWKEFVAWAKENGVNFPTPTFWLAPTEVG